MQRKAIILATLAFFLTLALAAMPAELRAMLRHLRPVGE